MATAGESERSYVGADVSEELHHRIRMQAAKEGKSMAQLIREILDREVDEL